jgi:transposase
VTLNRAAAACANQGWPCGCGCAQRTPRYPTDLTDEQWAALEPALPVMLCSTELGGRPEKHWRRTMTGAVFYLVDNGIKWRALPADFPPWRTVYGIHARWKKDGVLADITDLLRAAVRTAAGRHPEPSAALIDSQSVHESAEGVVPAATSGFDSHEKVNGRSSWPAAHTAAAAAAWPSSGPTAPTRAPGPPGHATSTPSPSRSSTPPDQQGFTVLPRRWAVERTNAWISRRRRARDYERLPEHHAAMVHWAAILQLTRRLARTTPP